MLPEDKVFGLAMQVKPVALSRGATTLGIRAALTIGHSRLQRVNWTLVTSLSGVPVAFVAGCCIV